jgi:outer membrane immunogenic protein
MMFAQMQRLLPASLALLALAGQAMAADLPVKALPPVVPAWSWAGFYAGINAGYSFGRDPFNQTIPEIGFVSGTSSIANPKGPLFGGQFGYNWQINQFVVGLEGDAQWAHQRDTSCGVACFLQGNGEMTVFTASQTLDWFATARARLGWANDSYLLYVTGGAAWGGVRESDPRIAELVPTFPANFNNTLLGWAAGAGIETRLFGNWTAKFEYLHIDLGSTSNSIAVPTQCGAFIPGFGTPCVLAFTLNTRSSIRDDIVRVGLNYQFGAPAAAAAIALPVKAPIVPWSWTGAYVGINAGYGVGSDPFTQQFLSGAPLGPLASTFANANVSPIGGLLGGQAGFNWQVGGFVFGLEGDAQWTNMHNTSCGLICTTAFPASSYATVEQKLDWFATVRGRLGWAHDGYLLYVTGGAAFGGIEETDTVPAVAAASFHQSRSGWTAGGGIETHISGNWTAKLEYLHIDLGSTTNMFAFQFGGVPFAFSTTSSLRDDIVRAGLNYKFGFGPVVASY